jgi:very-short-patch-repair endonuclease
MKHITDVATIAKREHRKNFLLRQGAKLTRRILPLGQDSLETMLSKCESPIEEIFLIAAYDRLTPLGLFCAQYEVARYRLDFALLGRNWKIAIECDGYKFHGEQVQLIASSWRDIDLRCEGWNMVAHFWGSDIYGNVAGCVSAVERLARAIR